MTFLYYYLIDLTPQSYTIFMLVSDAIMGRIFLLFRNLNEFIKTTFFPLYVYGGTE